MSNTITVTGNTSKDGAEIKFTPSGTAVANFRLAATNSRFDKNQQKYVDQGDPLWFRVECWYELAEQVADQMGTGTSRRVTVTGHLEARKFTTKEGVEREVIELKADSVCVHPLKGSGGSMQVQRTDSFSQPAADPWATPQQPAQGGGWGNAAPATDEPPFAFPPNSQVN